MRAEDWRDSQQTVRLLLQSPDGATAPSIAAQPDLQQHVFNLFSVLNLSKDTPGANNE